MKKSLFIRQTIFNNVFTKIILMINEIIVYCDSYKARLALFSAGVLC